jgi:hypothetical protein
VIGCHKITNTEMQYSTIIRRNFNSQQFKQDYNLYEISIEGKHILVIKV